MSSNDFDGSHSRPDRGQGADGPGAENQDGGAAGDGSYPAPEGWEAGGFWRDSSIDSDYETTMQRAVPPSGPHDAPGYSYWADGRGWENSPGSNPPGPGSAAAPAAAAYGSQTAVYGGPGARGFGPAGPAAPPMAPPGPSRPGGPGGPAGPGKKVKRKGSWWRRWTWKKVLAILASFFLLFVLGLVGVYEYLSHSATIPAALASANYQNSTVYYAGGKVAIGTIGTTNRQDLTFKEIPKNLQNAVLAAEDKNFFTEGGISPTGILRSAYDDLMGNSDGTAGGSTITQEFVRNYYDGVGVQQTVSRKVKEIFIAQKLASTESKQWIMTNYLNLIFLGDNSYGVAAAAQTYFGLPVSKLSISQDVVIASIIQQPSNYPEPKYRANLKARWTAVLSDELKDGFITQAQYDAAKFPKLLTDSGSASTGPVAVTSKSAPWAPYVMQVVENELTSFDHVSQQEIETGGLKVVTTISLPMESELYKAVDENIAAIKATPGAEFPAYIRIGAELQNPDNGEILAMYPGPGQGIANCDALGCDDNTAVYTREQVGSSFKPYVLSAAVADGMNVQTSTLNAAPSVCVPTDSESMLLSKDMKGYSTSQCVEDGLSGYFAVQNDNGEVINGTSSKTLYGSTVQNALAQSSNTAFSDLAHRVTTPKVIAMAASMGVNTGPYPKVGSGLAALQGDAGLALGTASLTVNEQTTMLSTIADDGVFHQSHIVKYWQQPNGPMKKPQPATHGVFDTANPTTNAQLDSQAQYGMEETTVDGTGTGAVVGLGSRPIIAKTGTSGTTSGFFIGAIKQYSLVVGIFTASQSDTTSQSLLVLSGGGFGGYWPAKIWNTFALAEFNNLPVENFQTPVFTGQKWNQIGKLPKKKKKKLECPETVNGKKVKVPVAGKVCPTPKPTSSPTPTPTAVKSSTPSPTITQPVVSPSANPTGTSATGAPTPSPTSSPTSSPTTTGLPTATPTATASPTFGGGPPGVPGNARKAVSGVRASLAVGGGLVAWPSLLLWAAAARRRRRRRAGTAE